MTNIYITYKCPRCGKVRYNEKFVVHELSLRDPSAVFCRECEVCGMLCWLQASSPEVAEAIERITRPTR